LIISVLLALTGIGLGMGIVFGSKVGPVTQVFTWACGACSLTITLADWRKTRRFDNAHFQALLFGLGAVLVEVVVFAAAAALVLAFIAFVLAGLGGC
jgi:hypothetical protein